MSDSAAPKRRSLFWMAVPIVLLGFIAYWLMRPAPPKVKEEPERSFAGSSDLLKEMSVLPTLDTATPEGKSAIWCISGQLAWNRLRDDIAKGACKAGKRSGVGRPPKQGTPVREGYRHQGSPRLGRENGRGHRGQDRGCVGVEIPW